MSGLVIPIFSMAFELLLNSFFREDFEKKFYFTKTHQKEGIREG